MEWHAALVADVVCSARGAGWSVRRRDAAYVFTRAHAGREDLLRPEYLAQFVEEHVGASLARASARIKS
jgi:hypothetical protein